jgi:hypothetical protein
MKKVNFAAIGLLALLLAACATDQHTTVNNPQKILDAVSASHQGEQNTLVYIGASDGLIAPYLAESAVEDNVNNGKVVAIVSALALKTTTVIVAGEDESLTAATLTKVFTSGKDKISGAKMVVIGSKDSQTALSALAAASGVNVEFMANPI